MRMMLQMLMCLALAAAGGCGTPSFLITPIANTNTLDEQQVEPGKGWSPPKVAIIEVEGLLANARSGGFLQPTENPLSLFTQELTKAEQDESVRAIVLRVNSPGGTVSASDAMYQMLKRFRAKTHKPVVASIQEVGASGAFYVSCGADKIVAQPTSVVGSIGVIFETLEFEGTLAKLGIVSNAVKSGTLKDMGSPFKPLQPDERAVMQEMIEQYFTRFIGVVRDNRSVTEAPLASLDEYRKAPYVGIFSGRVFSGDQAKKLGLIDETGLLSDAIDTARTLAKAPGAQVVMYKRPYGYNGSIYATSDVHAPQANVTRLELPGMESLTLPGGFYFLWRAGL